MHRHCSSRQPPECLVPHHHHLQDWAAIRHTSCKTGCCFASSYSFCSFLYTHLSKASKIYLSLLHPTVTAMTPSSIPAASLHLPGTLHPPYIRLLTPALPVPTCPWAHSLNKKCQTWEVLAAGSGSRAAGDLPGCRWSAMDSKVEKQRKKLNDLKYNETLIVFFTDRICISTEKIAYLINSNLFYLITSLLSNEALISF